MARRGQMLALFACMISSAWPADTSPASHAPEQRGLALSPGRIPYGHKVAYVRIGPAWARHLPVTTLKAGDILTEENLSLAQRELLIGLGEEFDRDSAGAAGPGFRVVYVDPDFDLNPAGGEAGTVGVTLNPFLVGLRLQRFGDRALPIPRTPWTRFAHRMPDAVKNLSPLLEFTNDHAYGFATAGDITHASPLDLGVKSGLAALILKLAAKTSVDAAFHELAGDVEVSQPAPFAGIESLDGRLRLRTAESPFEDVVRSTTDVTLTSGVLFRPAQNQRLRFDLGYGRSEDRLGPDQPETTTDRWETRLFFDMMPKQLGLVRAVAWADNLRSNGREATHRVALEAGYAREFPLEFNQTIGVEISLGFGRASSDTDDQWRFLAGNTAADFFYDDMKSARLLGMPQGPRVRSLGEAQGGLPLSPSGRAGGDQYWHMNVNVTFPIGRWSRPLIPAEDMGFDLPTPFTLKDTLRKIIETSGPTLLQESLAKQGMEPSEIQAESARIFDEITPAVRFIVDHANVFAVKPLLMFDVAELRGAGQAETWVAAGGGIQITVVTAKLEAGYMHTLSGQTFGARGNLFLRLGFTRLF